MTENLVVHDITRKCMIHRDTAYLKKRDNIDNQNQSTQNYLVKIKL